MIDPSGLLSSFVAALTAIAPFFVVVGIGWLAAKRGLFDESGLSGLNSFIFNIALPPLLFRAMASAPISGSDLSVLWYVALYGAPTLILYALAYGSGRAGFGLDAAPATLHAHLAVNGNAGFLGLALAPAVLGPEALVPMALALTFDILVVMTLTSVLLARASSVGGGAGGGALWRALMNPIPIAALGGAFWGLAEREAGMVTPEVVGDLLDLLGQAAAPAALFAVGATLAHKRSDRRIGEIGSLLVWKLAVHPAAVILALAVAAPMIAPEVSIDPIWVAGAALAASCPSSNNAVIFAVQHKIYEARASATVLISTALSLVTIATIAALVTR